MKAKILNRVGRSSCILLGYRLNLGSARCRLPALFRFPLPSRYVPELRGKENRHPCISTLTHFAPQVDGPLNGASSHTFANG